MLHGLHVVVTAKELAARLHARIEVHEARSRQLTQILEDHKDSGFIFVGERCHTPMEIDGMLSKHASRVDALTLMCNGLTEGETYALGLADLHAADLLGRELFEDDEESRNEERRLVAAFKRACELGAGAATAPPPPPAIIDGLKLTIPGAELRKLLEEAAECHDRRTAFWKREAAREDDTEEHPCWPTHICENEAERHEWRADVLRFIHDYIEESATYRVGREDVDFAELLPDKPGSLEQSDYEERTKIGFSLERLVKAAERLGPIYLPDVRSRLRDEVTT